jgi:hypothetical protein
VRNNGRQKPNENGNPPPFPQPLTAEKSLFARVSGAYFKDTVEQARLFWEQERYADSLALLRGGERDSIAGNDFAILRSSCEKTLGIALMAKESRKALVFFMFPASLALLFIIVKLLANAHRSGNRAAAKLTRPPWKSIAAALLVVGICSFFLINRSLDEGRSAVMKRSPYFNVPETREAAGGFLEEGTPVRVVTKSSNWIYVESENGSAGWVPSDKLVLY